MDHPKTVKTTEQLRTETLELLKKIVPRRSVNAITTNHLAMALGVQPGTIRRGLCVDGHYLGLKPLKGANGRLSWLIED